MDKILLKAVNRFNKVMEVCEDLNVLEIKNDDTLQAYQDPDFRPNSVSDLIKETKYQYSLYFEGGHALNDLKYQNYTEWKSRIGKLERLLKFLGKCREERHEV